MAVRIPLTKGAVVFADEVDQTVDSLDAKIEVSADGVVLVRVSAGNGPHEEMDFLDFFQMLSGLLPDYVDDAAAVVGGLASGHAYWVAAGNDAIPEGVLKKVL